MMKLEDFVANTITEIVRGAVKPQSTLGDNVSVNPASLQKYATLPGERTMEARRSLKPQSVDFDVQLTTGSSTTTSGKAGVAIKVLNRGTPGESANESEAVQRVRFSIPLTFDVDAVLEVEGDKER